MVEDVVIEEPKIRQSVPIKATLGKSVVILDIRYASLTLRSIHVMTKLDMHLMQFQSKHNSENQTNIEISRCISKSFL